MACVKATKHEIYNSNKGCWQYRVYAVLLNRQWMSPRIQSKLNELDTTVHVPASQILLRVAQSVLRSSPALQNCLSNHYQNVNRKVGRYASKWKAYFSSFTDLSCHVRHKVTHVLSRRFLCTHTRYTLVSFWPSCDLVRHCIRYIIFYIFDVKDLYRDISLMQKRDLLSIQYPFDEVIDFMDVKVFGLYSSYVVD